MCSLRPKLWFSIINVTFWLTFARLQLAHVVPLVIFWSWVQQQSYFRCALEVKIFTGMPSHFVCLFPSIFEMRSKLFPVVFEMRPEVFPLFVWFFPIMFEISSEWHHFLFDLFPAHFRCAMNGGCECTGKFDSRCHFLSNCSKYILDVL